MATPGLSSLSRLLLGTAGLGTPGCGPAAAEVPLFVQERRVDFGTVSEGQVLEHEWRAGVRAAVRVREAKTDCGCTLARLELERAGARQPYEFGSALVPGDVLWVSARYDTRGRSGPSTRAVHLDLAKGAPELPVASVLDLALSADVRPWLRSEPPALAFTRVRSGLVAERTFRVTSLSGEPFGLRATRRALPPWVGVEVRAESGEPDSGESGRRAPAWLVRATLGGEAPRGNYNYALELESDVPIPGTPSAGPGGAAATRHHALAPVWSVQVAGPVALSRPSLEFGLVGTRETVSQSLRLESLDGGYDPGAARARLVPVREGEPFPLGRTARVHVRPGASACEIEVVLAGLDPQVSGTFLARLVVETGHAELPELEALVRGTCRPRETGP